MTIAHAVTATPGLAEAEERGALTVSDRVVERVAAYAVVSIDAAAAAPRKMLGFTVGKADTDDEARVRADVRGSTATIAATLAVRWPESVRDVAEQARRAIRAEVQRITDVRVDHIDLDVVSLSVPTASRPRVR